MYKILSKFKLPLQFIDSFVQYSHFHLEGFLLPLHHELHPLHFP
jgi:hypothetical protein